MNIGVDDPTPESVAAGLLAESGSHGVPVDLASICNNAGAQVTRNYFDGPQSSCVYIEGSHRIVGVNSRVSPRRERFATAHALGHLVMHMKSSPLVVCMQLYVEEPHRSKSDAALEAEAHRFAGALLMPTGPLLDALRRESEAGHTSRDALIGALARRFEVSGEAMGWRLVSCGFATP